MMKVSKVMTRNPTVIHASDSVIDAARVLADHDIGGLPVEKDNRLIGMLTDRDIVVRVLAYARDPAHTPVEDVLSEGLMFCFEDEDAVHVAANMDELKVRRMPVMSRDKQLVGVVSIDDLRPRGH